MLFSLIVWLVVGALAGWLAGLLVRGGGFGLVANAVIGILGAVVAGLILPRFGFLLGHGLLGEVIRSTAGAVIVLVVLSLIGRARV